MRVKATAFGECRGKRKPGDEFDFEGKPSLKWMEPLDAAAEKAFSALGWKKPTVAPKAPAAPEKKNPAGDTIKEPPGKGSTGDQNVI